MQCAIPNRRASCASIMAIRTGNSSWQSIGFSCSKISNLFKTPWLLQRVLATSSGDIEVIRLLDRSAKHKTGSPWKSFSSFVRLLKDASNFSSFGKKDFDVSSSVCKSLCDMSKISNSSKPIRSSGEMTRNKLCDKLRTRNLFNPIMLPSSDLIKLCSKRNS